MLKISRINCLEIVRGRVTSKSVTFVFCYSSQQRKAEVHMKNYSGPGDVKSRGRLLPKSKDVFPPGTPLPLTPPITAPNLSGLG